MLRTAQPFAPTRAQLETILTSGHGDLKETPYRLLLLAIGLAEKSALLRLQRNQLQKEVVFESGSAIDCHSNIATETIGRFLVSTARLTEQAYRAALNDSATRGVGIEEVLTEHKLLAPSELQRAQQQNLARMLLEPFSWTSGRWEITYGVPPAGSALRVRIPQLLVTGVMKVEPQEVVDEAMTEAAAEIISPGEDPLVSADELRFTAEQRRVLDAAAERVAVRDLATKTGIPPEELSRILCVLALLRFVTVDGHRAAPALELDLSALPSSPEVVRQPEHQPGVEVKSDDRDAADAVMAAYLSFRRKDAFDLLGLPTHATPPEITRAYLAFAERFLPARFSESDPQRLRDKAQELFLAGARAYAELADPTRREALARGREPKPLAPAPLEAPVAGDAPATARRPLIDPEALWREGRAQAAKGKLREALSNFQLAADSDAQNATYAAEVAYCRYQLMLMPATAALKALKNAIRLDPRCAVAHLYTGRLQQTLGNVLEAEAYLDRARRLAR